MNITRVFLDTDLRCAFDGLRQIVKRHHTPTNHNIVFVNRKMTAFKVLSGNRYLVCYSNGGKRIPLEALWQLPEHFGGDSFHVNAAIKNTVVKALTKKGYKINQ